MATVVIYQGRIVMSATTDDVETWDRNARAAQLPAGEYEVKIVTAENLEVMAGQVEA